MLRHVLVAISLMGAAGAAAAEPLALSDQQLDTVTGGAIVAADFERIVENGVRGLVVTLTLLDEITGEVSTRTFGGSFTIPTPPAIPSPATIGLDITIGGGR
jgi:hypothetical protein